MKNFIIGQRWMSDAEPELGLGLIESVDRHQLSCHFIGAHERRIYSVAEAPLSRVIFKPGDHLCSQSGLELTVESISERNGILHYQGQNRSLSETELSGSVSLHQPEDRLFNGKIDSSHSFILRYQSMRLQSERMQSALAGFVGGRVDLIPHQLLLLTQLQHVRYQESC